MSGDRWSTQCRDLPVGQLIRKITPQLTDQETAAYDAPLPDVRFKAGVRTFPDLAMVEAGMEGIASRKGIDARPEAAGALEL